MKQLNKIIFLLAFMLSMWQAYAQPPVPTVYKDLGSGNKTITDTIKTTEKWYKWMGDSVVGINIKVQQDGSSLSLDTAELYLYNGTSLVLLYRDVINKADTMISNGIDSSLYLYAGYFPTNSTLYIRTLSATSTCTSCTSSYPIVALDLENMLYTCSPVTTCDLVKNGGFENKNPGTCGGYNINGIIQCWTGYELSTDVYSRGCTASPGAFNLGTNTSGFATPLDSHNGSPNNTIVGVLSAYQNSGTYKWAESIQSLLTTNLIPGATYQLSFWAFNYSGAWGSYHVNSVTYPAVITVASSAGTAVSTANPPTTAPGFPSLVHSLANFNVGSVNTWNQYTTTFVFSGSASENNLLIGINQAQNLASGYQGSSNELQYVALDDVSLIRVNSPTFTVTASPATICVGQSSTLTATSSYTIPSGSYTWMPGAITGSNVVVTPTATTVYTLTGTDICGKTGTTTINVTVNSNPSITASASPSLICPGSTSTLTATGSHLSYAWQPGSLSGITTTVSPTAPTIYTVTATNLVSGCTGTATAFVNTYTINPTSSSNVICIGNSATLTANTNNPNSTSYTWQPGGLTGTTAVVSPTATTIYTVTGTDVNGCVMRATFTETVNAFSSLYASPATICPGSTVTLHASGATTYTWNPGNLMGPSVTVSPTVTTTYTLGGNITGCGLAHDLVTVTVLTPTTTVASITSSNPYPCLGSSTTLSANISPAGTYTYSWSGPLSASTSTAAYTPTNNAIAYLSVTDICGNVATASACVDVTATVCCTSSEVIPYNTTIGSGSSYQSLSNAPYAVSGVLTVSVNTTWTNCSFRMAGGSKILVNPGVRFTVSNCSFFSCQDMWQGIDLAHNGTASGQITISGSSIEDAYQAIHNNCLSTTTGGTITVTSTTFNKNYSGVMIENSQAATGSYSAHPFTTDNSSYTSQASSTSPGSSLKCSSYYTPIVKTRGFAGIQLNNVKMVAAGSSTTTSTADNTFSYMDYGMYVQESSAKSLYNQFSNLTGVGITGFPAPPTIGVGVYGTNASLGGSNLIGAQSCTFTNVYRAVETQKVSDVRVLAPVISNSAISTPSTCGSGCIGNTGIYLSDATVYAQTNYGSLTNCNTGVNFVYSTAQSTSLTISASNNTITTTGSYIGSQGILIQSAVNNFTNSAAGTIVAAANTVSNNINGVATLNLKNGVRISNNTITLPYASSGNRNGIRLNGTENATVDNNKVSSTSTSNASMRGFYFQLSPGCKTQCNTTYTVGQGFVFEGNCLSTGSGWANNTISTANDGLVLQSSGVIGKQGQDVGNASQQKYSGNQWLGTFGNSKTLVTDHGSSATSSILVLRNNTNEYPQPQSLNVTTGTGIANTDNYGTSTYNTAASILFNSINAYTCPTALTVGLKIAQDTSGNAFTKAAQDSALYDLVNNMDSTMALYAETKEINRQYVFGLMDRGYTTTHAGLNAFYAAYQQSAFDTYSHIDSLVLSNNYNAAQGINNGAPTITLISQNQQSLNAMLIARLQNPAYAYTQSDIDALNAMAFKCPLKYGTAVYQARALLSALANDYIAFTDNCDAQEALGKVAGKTATSATESFVLFPNPNNGSMTLSYHISQRATMLIYDVNGRRIGQQPLSAEADHVSINLGLSQGVYYYTVTSDSGQVLKTDKLIIIQ